MGILAGSVVSATPGNASSPVEPDTRTVEWSTLRRLALEAGLFPPAVQPVSEAELAELMEAALDRAQDSQAFADPAELARLHWWRNRYRASGDSPPARLSARVLAGYTGLGAPLDHEAGLAWSPGWNTTFEATMDLSAGRWWASITGRLSGQVAAAGTDFSDPGADQSPLTWPDWSIATGKGQVRDARLQGDAWRVDAPRALVGARLGQWNLSAGWAPRRTGPGLTGALVVDDSGRSFPSLTARRTRPFDWGSGFVGALAPAELLLSTGRLTERPITFRDADGTQHEKIAHPWFFQWLVGWRITSWVRTTFTHAAMAAPREGSLWGDLWQINFPLPGTTHDEVTDGPVTDRYFSGQLEFHWHNAPWPLLPASAGRAYWEYAGTDVNWSGPGDAVPKISAPASMVGVELLSPTWDLAVEYAELQHRDVLWYSNHGFPEGYSQDGWLLGNTLGGSGEAWTSIVRLRPRGPAVETSLRVRHADWGMRGATPGTGEMLTLGASLKKWLSGGQAMARQGWIGLRSPAWWECTVEYRHEQADPGAYIDGGQAVPGAKDDWWRVYVTLGI